MRSPEPVVYLDIWRLRKLVGVLLRSLAPRPPELKGGRCLHCGGQLLYRFTRSRGGYEMGCTDCKCRWGTQHRLLKWGCRCQNLYQPDISI